MIAEDELYTPEQEGTTKNTGSLVDKKSRYWSLVIAKLLSLLIMIFGGLAVLALLGIHLMSAFSSSSTSYGSEEEEIVDDYVVEQRLHENLPPVELGTGDYSVEESAENIVSIFDENNAVSSNYWEFRNVLSHNAKYFVDSVGTGVVIDSPNQIGSDVEVILTNGQEICSIALERTLSYSCN